MKYALILLCFLNTAQAEFFQVAGSQLEFESKEGLLVKGCKTKCEALNVIKKHKKINLAKLRKGMPFTNSVGSDVCKLAYNADSVLGLNKDKDGRAFCVFRDQSLVEMNSLTSYLTERKIVTE